MIGTRGERGEGGRGKGEEGGRKREREIQRHHGISHKTITKF